MVVELNNPTVEPVVSNQEPTTESLEVATEPTVEGTESASEQPIVDSKASKQAKGVNLFEAIKKLSPEEQQAFKEYQTDYTKKAASLSDYEKRVAETESILNQMVSDPDIGKILESRRQTSQKQQMPDFSKMSDEEIFNWTVDQRVNQRMQELEQKIESKYGRWYNDTLVEQGNKIMQDFSTSKNIPIEEVRELAKYAVSHNVSLDESYKVKYFDEIPKAAKQEALEELEIKKNANLETGHVSPNASLVVPEKPTIRQAADLAEKQTGLKW
jgi:hypothetical protein